MKRIYKLVTFDARHATVHWALISSTGPTDLLTGLGAEIEVSSHPWNWRILVELGTPFEKN